MRPNLSLPLGLSNFLYKDDTTIQSCNVVQEGRGGNWWVGLGRVRFGVGWVGWVGSCLLSSPLLLSVLHLLADLVAQDLVPVDLGACHRKLAA